MAVTVRRSPRPAALALRTTGREGTLPTAALPTLPFIGTAGWSIPRIHQASFPVGSSHLERYAAVFSAVEINTSFYRPHRRTTYQRWAEMTPEGFRFSVKAPKTVTHVASDETPRDLDAFVAEISGLGTKLGPILIQLPPRKVFDSDEARRLLSAFRDRITGGLVLEPRHPSWFTAEANDLLLSLEIARVAADPPRAKGASLPGGWPGLFYYRLHGSPQIYRSPYGQERLQPLARHLLESARAGSPTWCIFDNTTSYAAAGDALTLHQILQTPDAIGRAEHSRI